MKYSLCIAYFWKDDEGETGIANDILHLNFRPNTAEGIRKIIDYMKEQTGYSHIVILNLIPLVREVERYEYNEDDM